ncbi:class I SAM-dependent methyltransferase [Phaeobacter sp. 11ANDIMAR09]|uniref:class I SAM-dependent methyltransferase n=1 Tax=Phaeobacter sp. 11ANDIMAR09 TaxID=1225647 RepID=UPI0006C83556|nr:class I SAM-dependent methyltransferase [Phaeobacter sp. 11ANDIMAR09]KPD11288.1 methyltransferase type 11 [Phaeobacter sp. 11ANDIMAR09]
MSDWTSGYVAEVDYTHDFFHEMTPAVLALTATSKGQKHGLNQSELSYCELGCGQGFTSNLLAAANPHIQFHAMDFNPAHIAGARELAAEGGLNNIQFYERSFADFEEEGGLPKQFDVIALHGVMSWVSEENQQLIVDFIGRRLKSGGIVYVSYNSLSAWAAIMPLRRILLDRAAQGAGPLEERIGEALNFAKTLEGAGAQYFKSNPMASAGLKSAGKMSANYLAHEMFNADWTPFHFADLAGDLSEAKLNFLGPTSLMDHIDDICLTAEQIAVLDGEIDPVRRESLRDVLVNEQFRSDLFVKGGRRHTERGAIGAWFETPFALVKRFGGGPIKLTWRQGEIALDQAQYGPILQALRSGPATVRSLLDQGAFGQMTWAEISRLLTILVGSGTLSPCLPLEGRADRIEGCQAFNLAVCKRAEDSETLRFLASPVTGGGLELDRIEQLFLLAYSEGKTEPSQWADLVWGILSAQGQRLQHEGQVLERPEENLALLQARATAFAARRLPLCRSLGLIPAASGQQAALGIAAQEAREEAAA